jgi:hypothetical protein
VSGASNLSPLRTDFSLQQQREVEHRICVVRGALKLPLNACVKLCEPSLLIKQVAKRLV